MDGLAKLVESSSFDPINSIRHYSTFCTVWFPWLNCLSMSVHIIYDPSAADLMHEASHMLHVCLKHVLIDEGRPVLLLLSGGSHIDMLNSTSLSDDILVDGLTISTLDERFTQVPRENNYLQIMNRLSDFELVDKKVRTIPTIPEDNETLPDFTQRIRREFMDWFTVNRDGKIIITQGIGEDGHTAGIQVTMSEEEFNAVFDTEDWLVGYTSQMQPQKRLTVSPWFLQNKVDAAIIYATGQEKAWAMRELVKEDFKNELYTLPARVVWHMRDVHIFTDQDVTV